MVTTPDMFEKVDLYWWRGALQHHGAETIQKEMSAMCRRHFFVAPRIDIALSWRVPVDHQSWYSPCAFQPTPSELLSIPKSEMIARPVRCYVAERGLREQILISDRRAPDRQRYCRFP